MQGISVLETSGLTKGLAPGRGYDVLDARDLTIAIRPSQMRGQTHRTGKQSAPQALCALAMSLCALSGLVIVCVGHRTRVSGHVFRAEPEKVLTSANVMDLAQPEEGHCDCDSCNVCSLWKS